MLLILTKKFKTINFKLLMIFVETTYMGVSWFWS